MSTPRWIFDLHMVRCIYRILRLVPVSDPSSGKVVRRHLDGDTVAFQDPNAEAAKLTCNRREHVGSIIKRDTKRCTGKYLSDSPFEFDQIFLSDISSRYSHTCLGVALETNQFWTKRLARPHAGLATFR